MNLHGAERHLLGCAARSALSAGQSEAAGVKPRGTRMHWKRRGFLER
jgi:hypothetical protein